MKTDEAKVSKTGGTITKIAAAFVIAILAILVYVVLGSSHTFDRNLNFGTAYDVIRVVDGDTVRVRYEGKNESVRLIGINTPETVAPGRPIQYYGPQASTFAKNLLAGEKVYLLFEPSKRDRYGRLLAYLYRAPDKLFVNEEIVRQGYGRAYTRYRFKHSKRFVDLQRKAKSARKGLWAGRR